MTPFSLLIILTLQFYSVKAIQETHREKIQNIKQWADDLNSESFKACDIPNPLEVYTSEDILVRTVSCKSTGAIKR